MIASEVIVDAYDHRIRACLLVSLMLGLPMVQSSLDFSKRVVSGENILL
jgi:hypothetical protein